MSIKLMTWVWENCEFDQGALLVSLAIADSANDLGYTWVGPTDLARKSRLSVRQVYRLLARLIVARQIYRHPPPHPGQTARTILRAPLTYEQFSEACSRYLKMRERQAIFAWEYNLPPGTMTPDILSEGPDKMSGGGHDILSGGSDILSRVPHDILSGGSDTSVRRSVLFKNIDIWPEVCEVLKSQLELSTYERLIARATVAMRNDTVIMSLPDRLGREWLQYTLLHRVEQAIEAVAGRRLPVIVEGMSNEQEVGSGRQGGS